MSRQETDFAEALLIWYDANRRILPWREDPTPYHVWLSEIMLQQTRVEAVKGYYQRFLGALPDIGALAAAPEQQYMKLWEGLGYYSRVRNLHKAAVQIMEEYDGIMPDTAAGLLQLSGIGSYTAAAIASIAFGRAEIAVDGNLLRIYARMTAYEENIRTPRSMRLAKDWFSHCMERQPVRAYGNFNQALMDLGAMVCLPNAMPHCQACPWQAHCLAHAQKKESTLPVMPAKKERRVEKLTVFLIQDEDRTVLRKRPSRGLLAGLYELPNTSGHLNEKEAVAYVRSLGIEPLRIQSLGEARHIFTHIEWQMTGYRVQADTLSRDEVTKVCGIEAETETDTLGDRIRTDARSASRHPAGALLLADTDEIAGKYSIPSAFAAYTGRIGEDFVADFS